MALQEIGPRFTLKLRSLRKGLPAVQNFGEAPKVTEIQVGDLEAQEEVRDSGAAAAPQGETVDEIMAGADVDAAPTDVASKTKAIIKPPTQDEFLWVWKVCGCFSLHAMLADLETFSLSLT